MVVLEDQDRDLVLVVEDLALVSSGPELVQLVHIAWDEGRLREDFLEVELLEACQRGLLEDLHEASAKDHELDVEVASVFLVRVGDGRVEPGLELLLLGQVPAEHHLVLLHDLNIVFDEVHAELDTLHSADVVLDGLHKMLHILPTLLSDQDLLDLLDQPPEDVQVLVLEHAVQLAGFVDVD